MKSKTDFKSLYLIAYATKEGKEHVGLAVELKEAPDCGVQVRVLVDFNVVSGVNVIPLRQSSCCG